MGEVEDAIILAGGLGTRMLPASLFAPKEMLPLIDTPILNHLIWEAARAGVSRVHLVVSQRKMEVLDSFMEFSNGMSLETSRDDLPGESLSFGIEGLELITHVQHIPGGVADAISIALEGRGVGESAKINGAFLVLLGDNLLIKNHVGPAESGHLHASGASLALVKRFEETGLPCVGTSMVSDQEVGKFGCIEFEGSRVARIVEKPDLATAPSNYILCGRYLFPHDTAEILENFSLDDFGEMQSIALMEHLINNGGLESIKLDEYQLYDSGDPVSWLKSQIDHSLRRSDFGEDYIDWVRNRFLDD